MSDRNRMKSNKGFTLTEIMIVLVILGFLAGAYVLKNYAALRAPAQMVTADSLQSQIESSYSAWANAGGTHGTAAATVALQANMAYDLLEVLSAAPGTNKTATNTASTFVVEGSATGPAPQSNLIRMQLRGTLTSGATGATVSNNNGGIGYYILFKPTTSTTGIWKVSPTVPTAIP